MTEAVVNCSNGRNKSPFGTEMNSFNLSQMCNQVSPNFDEDDQIEISLSLHKSVFQNMGSDHTKLLLINSLLTQCLGTLNIKPLKGQQKSSFCSSEPEILKQEVTTQAHSSKQDSSASSIPFSSFCQASQMGSTSPGFTTGSGYLDSNNGAGLIDTTNFKQSQTSGGRMSFNDLNQIDLSVSSGSSTPAGSSSLNDRVAQAPGSPGAFLQYMGIESSSSNNNGGAGGGASSNPSGNFTPVCSSEQQQHVVNVNNPGETCGGSAASQHRSSNAMDSDMTSINDSLKCNSIANEFGTSTFQCKQCLEVFASARQLCAHAVTHIPIANRPPGARSVTKSPPVASSHTPPTSSQNPFHSNENDSLSHVPIYNANASSSVGKGKKKYSCPECNFTSDLMARVSQHMILHSGMRPHECQLCNKRFKRRYHLDRHLGEVHMGGSRVSAQQPATSQNLAVCSTSAIVNNPNSQNQSDQQKQQPRTGLSQNNGNQLTGVVSRASDSRLNASHFVSAAAANGRLSLLPPPNEVFALQAATNSVAINSHITNANSVERFAVPHFLSPLVANSNNR